MPTQVLTKNLNIQSHMNIQSVGKSEDQSYPGQMESLNPSNLPSPRWLNSKTARDFNHTAGSFEHQRQSKMVHPTHTPLVNGEIDFKRFDIMTRKEFRRKEVREPTESNVSVKMSSYLNKDKAERLM